MSDFSITKINEKIEKQSKFVEVIKKFYRGCDCWPK